MTTFRIQKTQIALIVVLGVVAAFLGAFHFAGARESFPNFDTVTEDAMVADLVSSHLVLPNNTVATSTKLVDLSDTTNFKHIPTSGSLEVTSFRFTFSSVNQATTTVKLGVFASSSAGGTTTDIFWFDEVTAFSGGATGAVEKTISYAPSVMKLDIAAGIPKYFVTGDKELNSARYATTTPILDASGRFSTPAVGDLVLQVYEQKGAATTTVSTLYRVLHPAR